MVRAILQDQCRLRRHAKASADTLRRCRPESHVALIDTGNGSKPWVVIELRPARARCVA